MSKTLNSDLLLLFVHMSRWAEVLQNAKWQHFCTM